MQVFSPFVMLTIALGQLWSLPNASAQQTEASRGQAVSHIDFVTLANQAYALHRQRKNAEAIDVVERAEREGASSALPQTNEVARAWNSLGMTLFELGYNERAKSAYDRAFAIANAVSAPDATLRADLLNNLGQVENLLGHNEKAREYLEAALALRQQSADTPPRALAVVMDNLATAYARARDLDKAEELHLKALEIFEREDGMTSDDAATAAGSLGDLYAVKRDYRRAEAYQLRAFDAHHRLYGIEHEDTLLDATNLAALYLQVGDEARTERLANLLLSIGGAKPGKQHVSAANSAYHLAEQAHFQWQLGLAERLAVRAVEIFRAVLGPNDAQTLKGLFLLASIQAAKSDFSSAEKNYRSLMGAYSAQGNSRDGAAATVQLAKVYREWRSYPAAIELLEKAIYELRAQKGIPPEDIASALGNLAQVYFEADNPSAAEKKYDEALTVVKDEKHSFERPWLLHGRALLWYHLGKYEQAQQGLEEALGIWAEARSSEHPFVATTIANLALVTWARNDATKTVELLSRVSEIRERELHRTLTVGTEQQRLGYARGMQSDLAKALSFCFGTSGCTGDAARLSATLLLQRKGLVLDAITDTMRQIRQELSAEDRKLVYRLEAVRRSISEQMHSTLVSGQLPTQTEDLEQLLKQEADLQTALSYKSAAFQASLEPVTFEAVRRRLPAGATLIEFIKYSVFEPIRAGYGRPWRGERYAALVLSGESEPRWFNLGPAAEIENAVQAFRMRLRDRNAAYTASEAERLYGLVIAPLKGALSNPTRAKPPLLLIAPDGSLNIIPFGLLSEKNGAAIKDRFVVDYVSSGRDLLQRQAVVSSKQIVVIAGPDFNAQAEGESLKATMHLPEQGKFAPIPGTKKEAAQLDRLLDGVSSFTDEKATVAALRAVDRPAVLHIATHGVFIRIDRVEPQVTSDFLQVGDSSYLFLHSTPSALDNPLLFSGLALAGANKAARGANSGIISALEISGLQLQGTQLVVLSACETGLGTTRGGEEFSGLRRAISIAGAASQVTSLWKVDDAATSALMVHYYGLLLKGAGRAEALQLAQKRIQRGHPKWRHPFYWAGFIVSGDWKPIDQLAPRAGKRGS